jgi:hypothetical protein
LVEYPVQVVDPGVPGDFDGRRVHPFAAEIRCGTLRWGEVPAGHLCDKSAIQLFGERVVEASRSQPGFYVRHRYALIEGGQRTRQAGGCVALHNNGVRSLQPDNLAEPFDSQAGEGRQRLPVTHKPQLVADDQMQRIEHLVEHFLVLASRAHHGDEPGVGIQRAHERGELDGFRAGAEND